MWNALISAGVHGGNQTILPPVRAQTSTARGFKPADGVVQGHTAADVETGIPFLHQFRSGRGIAVVCLDDTSFHLGGDQPPGDLVIVKPTGHDIGRRMQVEIVVPSGKLCIGFTALSQAQ